ncbi:MAG: hypothetical protein ACM3H9_00220 [Rhodospirillaceae bacterium]
MRKATVRILTAGVTVVLAGCATTTFISSWKAPDAQPMGSLAGQKVVAVVMAKSTAVRRAAEDALATALSEHGALGVQSYSLIPQDVAPDEAKAKAIVEGSGAVAVVVMRPVAKDQEISSAPSSVYLGPMYGGYWGGYYGYGWGGAWAAAPDIRTDTIITVETLVYSLKQNKLVWAGESRTTNPAKVDAFVQELAAGAAKEMQKLGLL